MAVAMEEQLMSMLLANRNLVSVVLVLVAAVTAVALHYLISSRRHHARRLPPGPMSLPVIGHLHLLRSPVHRTLRDLADRAGPLMHIRLGSTHCVVASNAEVARELIRGHEGSISDRPLTEVARQFAYGGSSFVFAPYDAYWRFIKRLCMSELLGPLAIELHRPVRRAGAASLLRAVLEAANGGEKAVDLTHELIRFSHTSVLRMIAGTAAVPGSVASKAREVVKDAAELVGAFNAEDYIAVCRGWDPQGLRRRAAAVHVRYDALLEEMIRHKEKAREASKLLGDLVGSGDKDSAAAAARKDMLDILMDKAEDKTAELKLTREKIKSFIIDVMIGGSDTMATMVEWMLAELLNHPECLRKVVAEIDGVVGGGRIVGEEDLPQLPYLMAAYKETLRLHPPAPVTHRQSSEEMEIRGFAIPQGTMVFINIWAIGRDPAFWEDPLAFVPERFMPGGAAEGMNIRGQQFQLMPFGSGRRGCPGMGLALQSVPAMLAALVQCFDWSVAAGGGMPLDMGESDGLVCARKEPLVLRPTPRLNPFPAVV
ncbi:unnamed protein product [Urochloa decumbens]|uniref:3,9-dihydroxypterocarpan 6A-monooxygenase n=1 Tax=Urochloa decumbens TaxID=240449 RepID=A0ABC9GXE7_9POAL